MAWISAADKVGFLDCLGQRGAAHWEDDLFDMEIKWDGGAPISHPGLGVDWGLFNHSYQPGPLLFNWPRREAWGGREERKACRTPRVNRELMEPIIQRWGESALMESWCNTDNTPEREFPLRCMESTPLFRILEWEDRTKEMSWRLLK